jgi:ribonuclease HI
MQDFILDEVFEYDGDCNVMEQLSLFADCTPLRNPVKPSCAEWRLYVDGASRHNPGPSGAGVYVLKNGVPVYQEGFYLGTKTNNQAEYHAMLLGVFYCKQNMAADDVLYVISDSQFLIRQMKGEYKVKTPHIKLLYDVAWRLLEGINYSFCHVLRDYNQQADALANEGIQKKRAVPESFAQLLKRYDITF